MTVAPAATAASTASASRSGSTSPLPRSVVCVYLIGSTRTSGAMPARVVAPFGRAATRPAANVPRPSQSVLAPPLRTRPGPNCGFVASTPVPRTATVTPAPVVNGHTRPGFSNRCGHGVAPAYTPAGSAQAAPAVPDVAAERWIAFASTTAARIAAPRALTRYTGSATPRGSDR